MFSKAYDSACDLRNDKLLAARDVYFVHKQIEVEDLYLMSKYRQWVGSEAVRKESWLRRFRELFIVDRIRRATVACFVVMLAQQLCGINILSFFSSTFFSSTFSESATSCAVLQDTTGALWYSWGTGLVNFIFALPAIKTIDTRGRRKLLIWTFPNMAWAMLATGMSTFAPDPNVKKGLFIFFSLLFVAIYSVGEGPVPFTYSAESFPLSHRGTFSIQSSFILATPF